MSPLIAPLSPPGPKGSGTDQITVDTGKGAAVVRAAPVGDQREGLAARKKFLGERLRRKDMTAGPTGGENHGPRHWPAPTPAAASVRRGSPGGRKAPVAPLPARVRVSARTNPIPMASANIDEPP